MTASVYHFFKDLYDLRRELGTSIKDLENFLPTDKNAVEEVGGGQFPDMFLKTNANNEDFTGGELIEIKETEPSSQYQISSFNSTVPSGTKPIEDVLTPNSKYIKEILKRDEGRHPYDLKTREVYYLIRSKKNPKKKTTGSNKESTQPAPTTKVCLVHGLFFETVSESINLKSGVQKMLNEAIRDSGKTNDEKVTRAAETIHNLTWKKKHLSKTRDMKGAAVTLRFRVMAEIKNCANPLDANQYPQIRDNTLTMVVPIDEKLSRQEQERLMGLAWGERSATDDLEIFPMEHKIKGQFLVFQASL